MIIHVILPIETVKGLITPIMIAVNKSLPYCTSESAEQLLFNNSNLWAIVEECEDEEGGVDITNLYFEVQVETARFCSMVQGNSPAEQEQAWAYIMSGFKLFDSAVSSYIKREADAIREERAEEKSLSAATDTEEMEVVTPIKRTLH